MKKAFAALIAVILLAPAYAGAQTPGNIVLFDNFGAFSKGESVFIHGNVGKPSPDSYLILKITNPRGDICQIQQILPLQDGTFVTEKLPLRGNICGIAGEYDVEVFYGNDRNSAVFSVSSETKTVPTSAQYVAAGKTYVQEIIGAVSPAASSQDLKARLTAAQNAESILSVYRDAVNNTLSAAVLYEINPTFRPAVDSFLDAADSLESSGKITSGKKASLLGDVVSSVFYYEIGDRNRSLDIIYKAYDSLTGADPTTDAPRPVPYEELEDALLNLMRKTGSVMSRDVQEEIALIFSRGKGPIYSDELGQMLDMLTKTRFLDVILLKNDPLYNLLNTAWERERQTLVGKNTLEKLLAESGDVARLHEAAVLLRGLDSVGRFIDTPTGTAETNLVALIEPEWTSLKGALASASTAEAILDKKADIESMKEVAEISQRISKAVDLSQNRGIGAELSGEWAQILTDVSNASSLSEISTIISRFDATITELREKRNPVVILTFKYNKMREQAERQADYASLALINEAVKVLEAASRLSESYTANSRVDRSELLLTWASEQAPVIQAKLDAYTDTQFKERAGNILHRAKSLEVLVEVGLDGHRFDVGFADFADSINAQVLRIQNLVVAERLYEADAALDHAYEEWQTVLKAYSENPDTTVPINLSELKRITYRDVVSMVDGAVARYAGAEFAEHRSDYDGMKSSLELSLSVGNFAAADDKLRKLLAFVSDNLDSSHKAIIYDVNYNEHEGIWSASGYLDKENDRRVELLLNVYDIGGQVRNALEFVDTKSGKFSTFWNDRVDPGLYVTVVNWKGATSTKITYVEDPDTYDSSQDDPYVADAAKRYDQIRVFVKEFGGSQYAANQARFNDVSVDIEKALAEGNHREASAGIIQMKLLAERYLPQRDRSAVIEVSYQDNKIRITGAVDKVVQFSEDVYVDIYDENGKAVTSVGIKDSPTGYIDENVDRRLASGLYVAKIHYHSFMASDFFSVN